MPVNPYYVYGGVKAGQKLIDLLGGQDDPYKKQRKMLRAELGKDVIDVDKATQASFRSQLPLIKATERAAMRGGANFGEGAGLALDKISPVVNRSAIDLGVKNDLAKERRDSGIRSLLTGLPPEPSTNVAQGIGDLLGIGAETYMGAQQDNEDQ